MDELREAVAALCEAALSIKSRMADCGDPPSKSQLVSLQKSIDQVQQSLNRLQTAMDAWSEETENA
jgi:hypothetical protein